MQLGSHHQQEWYRSRVIQRAPILLNMVEKYTHTPTCTGCRLPNSMFCQHNAGQLLSF